MSFEYAISYSGLRGEKFRKLEDVSNTRIERIKEDNKVSNSKQKLKLSKEIKELEDELNIYNARVITKVNKVHKSTIQVRRFKKEDKELVEIFNILNSKFEEQYVWMCAPIYRDAIVFYSQEDKMVGILQICFSCNWIKNESEEDLEVDNKIFQKLKEKLIQIGHQIESE